MKTNIEFDPENVEQINKIITWLESLTKFNEQPNEMPQESPNHSYESPKVHPPLMPYAWFGTLWRYKWTGRKTGRLAFEKQIEYDVWVETDSDIPPYLATMATAYAELCIREEKIRA